ncbi:MAG TPA: hypothetical protein VFQ72_02575, partial [Candidatus Paceibacterota bacterium]|nr:hypothetical protein [Candidatus Paceibacterota bacterium]
SGPSFCPAPVVIVPGILGSAKRGGSWVIDPVFHTYDALIEGLKDAGYVASSTLFTFAYDWRRSNIDSAALFRQKMDQIKAACLCDKVDIVAHSMGGLVARSYASLTDRYDDIGKLIFLGTPHRGAPEDYLTWKSGDIRQGDIAGLVLKLILRHQARENGYGSIFDYVKGFPIASVGELLPIYAYFMPQGSSTLQAYPDGYPANPFLTDLSLRWTDLATQAERIVNIVSSTTASTVSALRVLDGQVQGFVYGAGDGTVPIESSSGGAAADTPIDSLHAELPDRSRASVLRALTEAQEVENALPLPASSSLTFGNSSVTQDVAQSFVPSRSGDLTEAQLYLKKTGSPQDLIVRLVGDDEGKPGTGIIASGTVNASNVGVTFGWARVSFPAGADVQAGSRYWIVGYASRNRSGYFILAANASFAGGQGRVGNMDTDTWYETSPSGLSGYFRVSLAAPARPAASPRRHIGSILMAMVLAPVDIMVTAPDGKRIGRDPATGAEVSEIADAFYSGFDSDDEFVAIPDPLDGEYRIDALGTGDGDFSVELSRVDDQGEASTTLRGQTAPGQASTFIAEVEPDAIVQRVQAAGPETPAAGPEDPAAEPVTAPAPGQVPLPPPVHGAQHGSSGGGAYGGSGSGAGIRPATATTAADAGFMITGISPELFAAAYENYVAPRKTAVIRHLSVRAASSSGSSARDISGEAKASAAVASPYSALGLVARRIYGEIEKFWRLIW